jgi:hypothetical protein
MRIIIVALLILTVLGEAFAEVPDSYIDSIIDNREQARTAEQQALQKEVDVLQKQLEIKKNSRVNSATERTKRGQELKHLNDLVAEARKKMKGVENKDYLPIAPLTSFKVGNAGRMNESVRVLQVIDSKNALCSQAGKIDFYTVGPDGKTPEPHQGRPRDFLLATDTSKFTDDTLINLDGVYAATTPQSFSSVLGAKRTLPVLEEIKENRIKARWEEFKKVQK